MHEFVSCVCEVADDDFAVLMFESFPVHLKCLLSSQEAIEGSLSSRSREVCLHLPEFLSVL